MDTSAGRQGQLVDPVGLQTRARDARENWWTLLALGHGPDSPGTACRHHGPSVPALVARNSWSTPRPSDPDPTRPGERFDPAGPRSRAGVARNIWFTLRGLGHGPDSPGTPARTRGTSDLNSSHLGELVDTTGPRPRARVPRDSWSTTDAWSTQLALGLKHEWPVRAGRPRWPFETGASHLGELVDPTGPWKRARVPRESSSTEGPRTSTRVARDSWLTTRALVHGPE